MQLVVGLGNPGSKYCLTRHNIGFMVIDAIAQSYGDGQFKSEKKAHTCKVRMGTELVLLAKPQTFMNLSGESVSQLMNFYNIDLDQLLVIHDEIELDFLGLRFQKNRGHAGHNGVRNIHQHLGSNLYHRLKVGVGRSKNPAMDVADYVLQDFDSLEQAELPDFLAYCRESVFTYAVEGFEKAATKFNRRNPNES